MEGFYVVIVLLALALALEPERTLTFLVVTGLKLQIWYLNLRMKFSAWLIYRSLVRFAKKHNMPEPGPFKFVDIWDR